MTKPRCILCNGTGAVILGDGPPRCRPCVWSAKDDALIMQNRTWEWLQDGVRSETYVDPKPVSITDFMNERYGK
jgi:hypothetical protein